MLAFADLQIGSLEPDYEEKKILENVLDIFLEIFLEIPYTRKLWENESFAHITESKFNLKKNLKDIFKNFFSS